MPPKQDEATQDQNHDDALPKTGGDVQGIAKDGDALTFSVSRKAELSIEQHKSDEERRALDFASEVARCSNYLGHEDTIRKLQMAQSLPVEAGSPGARFHFAYMMDGLAKHGITDSIVSAIAPRDGVEVLLATQMAAVQSATLCAARRLASAEYMEQLKVHEAALNRLSRTFATQVEALRKYRNGGTQTVRHVHVNEGGQAIVADTVTSNRVEGGQ